MSLTSRATNYLREKTLRPGINRRIRRMAEIVAKAAPPPDPQKLVISFERFHPDHRGEFECGFCYADRLVAAFTGHPGAEFRLPAGNDPMRAGDE